VSSFLTLPSQQSFVPSLRLIRSTLTAAVQAATHAKALIAAAGLAGHRSMLERTQRTQAGMPLLPMPTSVIAKLDLTATSSSSMEELVSWAEGQTECPPH